VITEFVFFQFPAGADREQVLGNYRKTADGWLANPDLVQKYYFFDAETGTGGGVYIWPSREDAIRWHSDEYIARVTALYGVAPRIQIFEALVYVNPSLGVKAEF
jgi:hypothetical protein